MSDDLIKRSDVYKAVDDWLEGKVPNLNIKDIPSADRPQGDFVSKRYLLAEIDDLADEFSEVDENGLHSERWCGILDSRGIIVNAPSVSDRPQGEWVKDKSKNIWNMVVDCYKCSNCGKKAIDHSLILDTTGLSYCPNCGADMRGKDDE